MLSFHAMQSPDQACPNRATFSTRYRFNTSQDILYVILDRILVIFLLTGHTKFSRLGLCISGCRTLDPLSSRMAPSSKVYGFRWSWSSAHCKLVHLRLTLSCIFALVSVSQPFLVRGTPVESRWST